MARYAFLIQYMVIYMLFLSYLSMPLQENPLKLKHLWIFLANVLLGFVPYFLLRPLSQDYALAAYMCGIIPSAIAAPVIMSLIHRDMAFTATAVLVTNLGMAIFLPATLPLLVGREVQLEVGGFVLRVLVVLLGPFMAAFALRLTTPKLVSQVKKLNRFTFYVWITAIWIAVAKSVVYLRSQNDVSTDQIMAIAAIALGICVVSFLVGHVIGGRQFSREASQSLGQKNIMLSIWISLTYLSPKIALGPTFYILFHHLYNGWLLLRYSDRKID